MEMLHTPRPEPPASLLARILAQTSAQASAQTNAQKIAPASLQAGYETTDAPAISPGYPAGSLHTLLGQPMLDPVYGPAGVFSRAKVLPFRTRLASGMRSLGQTMLQPRLAMTAAMAFFSIALTLNLTGIRLNQFRASDLKPSTILRTCYETKAKVVRYSDNLRVVYELESRVRDLQQNSDDSGQAGSTAAPVEQSAPAAQPGSKPFAAPQHPDSQSPAGKQTRPRPGSGSSRRESPGSSIRQVNAFSRLSSAPAAAEALAIAPFVKKPEGAVA